MGLFGPPNIEKLKADGDVSGLIKALGYGKDETVRTAAAEALVHIGAPAVEPLIAALADRDNDVRKAAAEALGQIGDVRAVEPLIAALPYPPAAFALGQIGDARAIEPLHAALSARYLAQNVQVTALALGQFGAPAVEPLLAVFMDRTQRERACEAAVMALDRIGAPAVEPLIAALRRNDQNRKTRSVAAVDALVKIGAPAVESLVAALADTDQRVRHYAAEALRRLAWSPDSGEAGASYWVARDEWQECVKIGARAVQPLIAVLTDWTQDEEACEAAAMALGEIGAPAVDPLVAAFKGEDDLNVLEAIAGALDRLAWRPDSGEAGAAYWSAKGQWQKCVKIGVPAVEPLIAALRDRIGRIREGAVDALGQIGDPRALKPLIAALKDRDKDIRKAAATGLVAIYRSGKMGPEDRACLLAHRNVITEPHIDSVATTTSYSKCFGQESNWSHTDSGIGVEFSD